MTPLLRPTSLQSSLKFFTLATVLALSLSACGDDASDSNNGASGGTDIGLISDGTLKVCSDVPYPPFEDFDKEAKSGFTGFDIDLMQEVADRLEITLEVQDSSFDGLQSGASLNSGACDVVASAMTISAEREQNLDFTEPYKDSEQSLLVPADSDIASIDDLAGKSVGVQQATTGKAFAEKNAPKDTEIRSFPSDAEMFAAIKAGQVDALLQDYPVNYVHATDGEFKIVQTFPTVEKYGFAVKSGNTALLEAINEQLAAIREDGTYGEISDKYFAAS